MIDRTSINSLFDAKVVDPDGERIGAVKQVYLDHSSGEPLFVTVGTGLFGTAESFVPVRDAAFDGHDLRVSYDKATIRDAPRIEADAELTEAEEARIWEYYDRASEAERRADAAGTAGAAGAAGTAGAGSADADRDAGDARDGSDHGEDHDLRPAADGGDAPERDADPGEGAGTGAHADGDAGGAETGRVRLRRHVVIEERTLEVPEDGGDPVVTVEQVVVEEEGDPRER